MPMGALTQLQQIEEGSGSSPLQGTAMSLPPAAAFSSVLGDVVLLPLKQGRERRGREVWFLRSGVVVANSACGFRSWSKAWGMHCEQVLLLKRKTLGPKSHGLFVWLWVLRAASVPHHSNQGWFQPALQSVCVQQCAAQPWCWYKGCWQLLPSS